MRQVAGRFSDNRGGYRDCVGVSVCFLLGLLPWIAPTLHREHILTPARSPNSLRRSIVSGIPGNERSSG